MDTGPLGQATVQTDMKLDGMWSSSWKYDYLYVDITHPYSTRIVVDTRDDFIAN